MSIINFQVINQAKDTKITEETSLPKCVVFGITTFSSSGRLPKLGVKKSAALAYSKEEKHCINSSMIPRPQMTASYSYNETLKNNKGNDKTKKAPSMIPRSKSRKRSESNKVIFDLPLKVESPKEELNKVSELSSEKSSRTLVDQNLEFLMPLREVIKSSDFCEVKNENLEQDLTEKSSLVLKSCQDFFEVEGEDSETSYKDAQESMLQNITTMSWRTQEVKEFPSRVGEPKSTENNEHEAEKQQKTIRNLYQTIKNTMGPLFDNLKWPNPKKITTSETRILQSDLTATEATKEASSRTHELESNFSSIQDQYEFTLKEISNIWKNAISLIGSVKDHTVKFVEEHNALVDKEQLTLEAEMLQLAIDFAISYSKLKMDFMVKSVRKSLNVKDLGKSELEAFMDSKTYAAMYNNEDLAAMARTVRDLNLSVLKGEDFEFE